MIGVSNEQRFSWCADLAGERVCRSKRTQTTFFEKGESLVGFITNESRCGMQVSLRVPPKTSTCLKSQAEKTGETKTALILGTTTYLCGFAKGVCQAVDILADLGETFFLPSIVIGELSCGPIWDARSMSRQDG
jgi:hypothetical protein